MPVSPDAVAIFVCTLLAGAVQHTPFCNKDVIKYGIEYVRATLRFADKVVAEWEALGDGPTSVQEAVCVARKQCKQTDQVRPQSPQSLRFDFRFLKSLKAIVW
jgi:hypothetical protein